MEKSTSPKKIVDDRRIVSLRGKRVIVDADLAQLYGVTTKRLNEQVRRNPARFPADFAFQLDASEWTNLRSQFATSSWGGRRFAPYAFTEHGALMAANVLNSRRAIEVSIFLVRTFIAMREGIDANKDLVARINELERKYDKQFKVVFDAIRALMTPSPAMKRPIGFVASESGDRGDKSHLRR